MAETMPLGLREGCFPPDKNNFNRMPVKSKKQAGFMGMIAAGKKKMKGLSPKKAKEFLRGVKVKMLPKKK